MITPGLGKKNILLHLHSALLPARIKIKLKPHRMLQGYTIPFSVSLPAKVVDQYFIFMDLQKQC